MNEFQLIDHFFSRHQTKRKDVILGIGDDAALLQPPAGQVLAISTDTLVADIHFFADAAPKEIGYRSLAVNLSDLAAMGAEPAWVMLSITLPNADEKWLQDFSQGFFQLIDQYNLQLVGGDTTKGPLSITVQVIGFVPPDKALKRNGAKPGDKVYVTGTLGDAGLALQSKKSYAPIPRVQIGLALRGIATSCIDISDGLAADLNHILAASHVAAQIIVDDLPLSAELKKLPPKEAWSLALSAGDDYQLCFTVPPQHESQLKNVNDQIKYIGVIEQGSGLQLKQRNGQIFMLEKTGFKHF